MLFSNNDTLNLCTIFKVDEKKNTFLINLNNVPLHQRHSNYLYPVLLLVITDTLHP